MTVPPDPVQSRRRTDHECRRQRPDRACPRYTNQLLRRTGPAMVSTSASPDSRRRRMWMPVSRNCTSCDPMEATCIPSRRRQRMLLRLAAMSWKRHRRRWSSPPTAGHTSRVTRTRFMPRVSRHLHSASTFSDGAGVSDSVELPRGVPRIVRALIHCPTPRDRSETAAGFARPSPARSASRPASTHPAPGRPV